MWKKPCIHHKFFPHSFKEACFPAESMLDKLNFSRSDKLHVPHSDVHTEDCLILLLQHIFPAAGRPAFFLWASWQKCKQFKALWYQLLFITTETWMLMCFPRQCISLELVATLVPLSWTGDGIKAGLGWAAQSHSSSFRVRSLPAQLQACILIVQGNEVFSLNAIRTMFSGVPLLRSFSRTQMAFLYLVL